MILDWIANCEYIFRTKTLKREDPSDNKYYRRQEIIYIAFLRKTYQYDKTQCWEEWKSLKNGIAHVFQQDEEQQRIEFEKVYASATSPRYSNMEIPGHLKPVTVYESEIKFLNGLSAPYWVKQYWLAMTIYYKFAVQRYPRVYKSSTANCWAIRLTEYKSKDYGGSCQDAIAKFHADNDCCVIRDYVRLTNDKYPTFIPKFLKKSGKAAIVLNSLEDTNKALQLLQRKMQICVTCGTMFPVSSKTKREECEYCYKRRRAQRIVCFKNGKNADAASRDA